MKAELTRRVLLELDISEAIWLRNVMQNPLSDKEDIDIKTNRVELFFTIKNILSEEKSSTIDKNMLPFDPEKI